MSEREIYAGMLVLAKTVEVAFSERREPREGEPVMPLKLYAVPELPGKRYTFASRDEAADRVSEAARYVAKSCPSVQRIGLCSAGPMESVNIYDRDSYHGYGRVSELATHKTLQGLSVYQLLRDAALNVRGDIRVHTDVMGGAIAESLDRASRAWPTSYSLIAPGQPVAFAHVEWGVGCTWASGGRPTLGALHSEVGATSVQLLTRDSYAQDLRKQRKGTGFPVRLEEVTYIPAMLTRAGLDPVTGSLDDIAHDHPAWDFEAEYIAQMIQLITMVVSPVRVILHGPVFETHPKAVRLLARVRKNFKKWVSSRDVESGSETVPVWYRQMHDAASFIDLALSANPMLRGAMMLAALPDEALIGPPPLG